MIDRALDVLIALFPIRRVWRGKAFNPHPMNSSAAKLFAFGGLIKEGK